MIKIIILVILIRKYRKSSITVNIKSNVIIHPCHVTGAGPYPTIFLPNHDFWVILFMFSPLHMNLIIKLTVFIFFQYFIEDIGIKAVEFQNWIEKRSEELDKIKKL